MLAHLSPAFGKHGQLPKGVGIQVGTLIPDVAARDSDGRKVRLRELAADGGLVLVFYRGSFCPFANFQLRALARRASELEAAGARPVLLTTDNGAEATATKRAHQISWPIVVDSSAEVSKAFALDHVLSESDQQEAAKHDFLLPRPADGGVTVVSLPGVFVVDRTGKVTFAHADEQAGRMLSVDQIIDGFNKAKTASDSR